MPAEKFDRNELFRRFQPSLESSGDCFAASLYVRTHLETICSELRSAEKHASKLADVDRMLRLATKFEGDAGPIEMIQMLINEREKNNGAARELEHALDAYNRIHYKLELETKAHEIVANKLKEAEKVANELHRKLDALKSSSTATAWPIAASYKTPSKPIKNPPKRRPPKSIIPSVLKFK